MASQAPMALSMILCDGVQVDRGTGKVTILEVFENVQGETFPLRHPDLTVFAELTDGHGQTPVTLKLCRTTADELEGEELHSTTLEMDFPDPRHIVRLIVRGPVDFPQPGEYRFILETEGAFIAERRLIAMPTGN